MAASSSSSLYPNQAIALPTHHHRQQLNFSFSKSITPSGVGVEKARPVFRVRAEIEDEWGADKESAPGTSVAVAEEPPKEPTEIDLLKKQFVDSFYGTNRGLRATSETRAEIVELITQLEAKNLTSAPTEALTLLNGKWILSMEGISGRLVYPWILSSSAEKRLEMCLFSILA